MDRETLISQVKHDHDYSFSVSSLSDIGSIIVEDEEVIVLDSVENQCTVMNSDSDVSGRKLNTNANNESASNANPSTSENVNDKDKVIANLKKLVKSKTKKISRLKKK